MNDIELETVVGIQELIKNELIVIVTEKRILNIDCSITESLQITEINGIYYVWIFELDIQLRMNKEQLDTVNSNFIIKYTS